jgi:hypothetical protein
MDLKKLTDLLNLTTPYKVETEISQNKEITLDPDEKAYLKQDPVDELLSWSVEIPAYKIPKKIMRSAFVFVFLYSIFLVLAQDWILLLVILGFAFLVNLLVNSKDTRKLSYKIYSNGFDYSGTFYSWAELNQFFYYEGTSDQLVITSKDTIPGRIYVYFNEDSKEQIDNLLSKYLIKNLIHPKDFYELIIFKIKPLLNLSDEK